MPLKKHEDIFIAREEFEKKKKRFEAEKKSQAESEKARLKDLHYMHCPKCGSQLAEITFRDVLIDKCISCQGVWLDAGELEQVAADDSSFLKSMLKIF